MHWYKKNIGDYSKKAGRLSMLQHGSYTLLIDACYDRERFPTLEEAMDWAWAASKEEMEAVEFVLRKFFTLEDGVYVQQRIREEIEEYRQKSENNKRIAEEREASRKRNSTNRAPVVNDADTERHLTNNQEPVTNNQDKPPSVDAKAPTAVREVFDHWQTVMASPRSQLDSKRQSLIRRALKSGYSVDDLKLAIDGCRMTPHNMGVNDRGTPFNGLDLILRDADHVDRFMETARAGGPRVVPFAQPGQSEPRRRLQKL